MADLSITAASVLASANAIKLTGVIASATTVTAGKVLYKTADNTYGLADSNGVSPINGANGVYVALTGGGAGQPVTFVATDSALVIGAATTVGVPIYLSSDAAGGMTETFADVDSNSTVVCLGVTTASGTLNLNPTIGGTKP
jgi:hypothetical protein